VIASVEHDERADALDRVLTVPHEGEAMSSDMHQVTVRGGGGSFVQEIEADPEVTEYGFRHLDTGDEPVLLFPVSSNSWRTWELGLPGAAEAHGAERMSPAREYRGFRSPVSRAEIAEHDVLPALSNIIDAGRLNEERTRGPGFSLNASSLSSRVHSRDIW
jgi:hypothetical protein